MRALSLVVVASLLTMGCTCHFGWFGRNAFEAAWCVARAVEEKQQQKQAKQPIALDSRGGDGMLVTGEHFTFVVPATWRARGPNAFADPAERHAVAIAAYDKSLDPDAWVHAYYADARAWPATIDGRSVVFARAAKQVTVLVVASDTELFELTCAQSDVSKAVPNAVCSDVFNSFRLR